MSSLLYYYYMSIDLTDDKIALLRLAFKGLAEEELQELASLTRLCTYPADHVLCLEGADEDIFYIIADGSLVISKRISEQEGERVLRVVGQGEIVGEMALIQNAPRSATVRSLTEFTVLEMNKLDFETMLSRSPSMAINIIRTTLDRMRENDQMAIEDLQRTNKILRQLDRNKLEFIQIAAHELRTPLTVLKGYLSVLRSFPDIKANPALADVLEGVGKGADRMHEVVNLMLDIGRIDNNALKVMYGPVSLRQVIGEITRDFAKAIEERKIRLSVDLHPEIPYIDADPSLLQKALYHLIVNAIKYTPDGGSVWVSTCPVQLDSDQPGVEITIRDTGIGIDAEHHQLIFEKFYQVGAVEIHSSGKTTYKGGGSGLGLAIVRGVTRAHQGKVWVESPGHDEVNFPGSIFHLQLPVNPPGLAPKI